MNYQDIEKELGGRWDDLNADEVIAAVRRHAIEDCIRVAEQFAESYADCLGRRHAKTHAACAIVEALRMLAKG